MTIKNPLATGRRSATPQLDTLIKVEPDLVDRIFDYVLEIVPEIAARKDDIKRALRQEFRGERSIRQRDNLDGNPLAREVLRLFNGRNATEVARKLAIHRATVYRLLKQPGRR